MNTQIALQKPKIQAKRQKVMLNPYFKVMFEDVLIGQSDDPIEIGLIATGLVRTFKPFVVTAGKEIIADHEDFEEIPQPLMLLR